MTWRKTEDGWVFLVESEVPDQESTLLAEDAYLKVYVESHKKMASYRIQVDKRRSPQILEHDKWIVLFFGKCPDIRRAIRGVKLWRDKCVVIERFGTSPRMYCIVAR